MNADEAMTSGIEPCTVEELLKLARDKSKQGRSALAAAIDDLYSGQGRVLTTADRSMMFDILRQLIHEVEAWVRRNLAIRFADQPDVPRDLIVALANDEIDVAYPVLAKSELLRNEELIEIVQQCTMEHQVAIAMRPIVAEPVSDALVDTGHDAVITALISNDGARFTVETMDHLVELSKNIESYQLPLVNRRDLSPQVIEKLYLSVSEALRAHLVEKFDIDPSDFDNVAEDTIAEVMSSATGQKADDAAPPPQKDPKVVNELIELLRQGEIFPFLDRFTQLSGLRANLIRRFLFEPGGQGLAVACRAMGLDKHVFVSIFMRFRQGRIGDKQVDENEVSRALDFFERVTDDAAKQIVARWRQDREKLNALRLAEEAGTS